MLEVTACCEDILFPSFRYPDFGTAIAKNLAAQHYCVLTFFLVVEKAVDTPTLGVSLLPCSGRTRYHICDCALLMALRVFLLLQPGDIFIFIACP